MIVELDHRLFLQQDYAIINPMQVSKDQYADLAFQRLLPKGLGRHERMMPLLVYFSGMTTDQRIELLERSDQWGCRHETPLFSALLESSESLGRMRSHLLRSMLMARSGSEKVWLRMHDPRVFGHLCWIFNDEQMVQLMGPIRAWSWFNPLSRKWHKQERPAGWRPAKLWLSEDQWQRIEQLEALNHCLKIMAKENCGESGEEVARQLSVALSEAVGLGLKDIEDLALYALQNLAYGPGLGRSEEVRRRLATMAQEGISYQGVCLREVSSLTQDNCKKEFEGESI